MNTKQNEYTSHVSTEVIEQVVRILVVEDDPLYRVMWEQIFLRALPSWRIHWATTFNEAAGQIAAAIQHSEPFHFVISDVFLPGDRTGVDLWRVYKSTVSVGFILMSGSDHLTALVGEKNHDGLTLIHKPFNIDRATYLIRQMTDDHFTGRGPHPRDEWSNSPQEQSGQNVPEASTK